MTRSGAHRWESNLSDASVVGLGAMGSALARALLHAGHRVTVWNRTSKKAEPLARDGAAHAADLASAIVASPVVLICVDNYEVTRDILSGKDVRPRLPDRILVQLRPPEPQRNRLTQLRRPPVSYASR